MQTAWKFLLSISVWKTQTYQTCEIRWSRNVGDDFAALGPDGWQSSDAL